MQRQILTYIYILIKGIFEIVKQREKEIKAERGRERKKKKDIHTERKKV